MRWLTFGIAAWVFFGLELGLRGALELGNVGVAPSFALALLAFVAMWASGAHVVWAGVAIGALIDLTTAWPLAGGGGAVTLLGPYAVGCACGAYAGLQLRALMIRSHPLAMGALALLVCLIVHAVVSAFITVRSFYPSPVEFEAGRELFARGFSSLYTAGLAVIVGPVLGVMGPAFGFQMSRRRGWG